MLQLSQLCDVLHSLLCASGQLPWQVLHLQESQKHTSAMVLTLDLRDWGTQQAFGHAHEPLARWLVLRFGIPSHNYCTVFAYLARLFTRALQAASQLHMPPHCDCIPVTAVLLLLCTGYRYHAVLTVTLGRPSLLHCRRSCPLRTVTLC